MNLLATLQRIGASVGNTPLVHFQMQDVNCYTKLEYNNFSGSIKDRAVYNILYQAIQAGRVTEDTTLIESSSGNFAVSIASMCNLLGLKFIGVIDPNVNKSYEHLLGMLAHKIIKVTERDETGGYLLNRIREVKRNCLLHPGFFWTDQYENPDNYLAYFNGLGVEIGAALDGLDFAFIAVSTCGTITGLSRKLKEMYPNVTVVGVDIEGSLVFPGAAKKRYISGIGSSQRPSTLEHALIDYNVQVSHLDIIGGCHDLLREQSLFAGASTGAMYAAIKQYVGNGIVKAGQRVLFICCDKGNAYLDTVYNPAWVDRMRELHAAPTAQA